MYSVTKLQSLSLIKYKLIPTITFVLYLLLLNICCSIKNNYIQLAFCSSFEAGFSKGTCIQNLYRVSNEMCLQLVTSVIFNIYWVCTLNNKIKNNVNNNTKCGV